MKTELTAAQSTHLSNLWLGGWVPGVKFISLFSPWELEGRTSPEQSRMPMPKVLLGSSLTWSPMWVFLFVFIYFCLFVFFCREPERWEWSEWGARNTHRDDANNWAKGQTGGFLRGTTHKRKGWRPALWKLRILQGLSAEQDMRKPHGEQAEDQIRPNTLHSLLLPFTGYVRPGT